MLYPIVMLILTLSSCSRFGGRIFVHSSPAAPTPYHRQAVRLPSPTSSLPLSPQSLPQYREEEEVLPVKPPNMSEYLDNTTNEPKHDIWVMLYMCSPSSSKHVNECRKTYRKDVEQYGRKGQPCCSRSKLASCLSSGLKPPCDRFAEPMVQLIANSTRSCEDSLPSYPSLDCFIILNTNLILGVSITVLAITIFCAIIHVCKSLCRCCRRSFKFCQKFDRTSVSST